MTDPVALINIYHNSKYPYVNKETSKKIPERKVEAPDNKQKKVTFDSLYYLKNMLNKKHIFNAPVFAVTTLTTYGAVLATGALRKKFPTPVHQSRLKELMNEVVDLGIMAIGSIGGGLAAGVWADKGKKEKNHWNKIKEANYQLISNNLTPVVCQAGIIAGLDKFFIKKAEINKLKHNLELNRQKLPIPIKKWQLYINKVNGLRMVGGLAGIVSGLFIGQKISDVANNKLITKGEKYDRKIKPQDFIIQSDNVFSAMSLLKIPYVKSVIMPLLSVVSGYEAGTK